MYSNHDSPVTSAAYRLSPDQQRSVRPPFQTSSQLAELQEAAACSARVLRKIQFTAVNMWIIQLIQFLINSIIKYAVVRAHADAPNRISMI